MAKYDLHSYGNDGTLLLDVQADLLGQLNTRLVVPLIPQAQAPTPARRLNPVFTIDGTAYVMVTQFAASVPVSTLGKPVDHLKDAFAEITDALDMLLQGF